MEPALRAGFASPSPTSVVRTIAALMLSAAMVIPQAAAADEALGVVGRSEAVWTSPPAGTPNNASVDGPLLGNGDMLATISGPPQKVVVHLGKNDFWRLKQGDGNTMPLPVGTLTLQCADLTGASYQLKQSLADATTHAVFGKSDGTLRLDAQVLAGENLLLVGLTAEQRAFQVRCDLAAASGRGSVSSAGSDQGALWMERSFPAGTVDVPAKADCALVPIGSTWSGGGSGRAQAAQFANYNVNLGREQWSGGARWAFDGAIDELAVYQVALDASEVASLYGGTVPQTGLVRYWSMESLPPGSSNAVTVAGRFGSATDYQNSASSYSNIGTTSMPLDVVSVATWLKIDTTQTANYLLSCGEWNQGVSLGLSGGKVRFSINGTYLETGVLPTGQWVHVAATQENGSMKIWLNGALAAQNSASAGGTITVQPGTTTWLALAMDSLFKSATPREDVVARCAGLNVAEIPTLQAAHQQWWAGYWDQSWIDVGDPVIEKAYYLGYHGMGACSRDPEFPPGIFGWVTTDSPSWWGDYHLNYNFQAPFYALASGNRLEQLAPHDGPVLAFMERAKGYSNAIFGAGPRGVFYPVGIGPRGIDSTYNSGYSYPNKEAGALTFGQRSNAAYCVINMAEHWRATYDDAYGASIYPFVKEVAAFWESYLVKEGTRYKIVGDSIHEGSGSDVNPILTLGLVRNVFDLVLDLSAELGVDADKRAAWRDILENLSGYTTQQQSGSTVFRYTESGTAWWGDNTLGIQHIYPAGALDLESEPTWVNYGLNTIEVMQRWFDTNGSNSFFPAAVRIGYEPRVILTKLRDYAGRMRPNGFQQNNPHGIENLSTVPGTINEMLCMSHVAVGYETPGSPRTPRAESLIRVFGCWPRERDARFERLRAWGGFLVSSSLWAGEVQYVEVFSEQGRGCRMRNPWPGQAARVYRHGIAAETLNGAVWTIPTSEGETILVLPGENEIPASAIHLRMKPPAERELTVVDGQNLSFESGASGWTVSGGTSTFAEDGSSTNAPLPDGSAARGLRSDPGSSPVSISQALGPAVAGVHLISYSVADRIAERWLNYKVELLAGDNVIFSRDSGQDASLRPPNGSTSHPGAWGRGGKEGDWHQVRLQASVPQSLAGQPLTLRFVSTTTSSGDNGSHDDFALDAVQVKHLAEENWPLTQELKSASKQPDGSVLLTVNWLSQAGRAYRVESSEDLGETWTVVLGDIAATPPVNSITVEFPPSATRGFLRVVEQ